MVSYHPLLLTVNLTLCLSAAFATYVIATIQGFCATLWHATAWAFLRDVLLEVINDQSHLEDQSIRAYFCCVFMTGLKTLTENTREDTCKLRSSPTSSITSCTEIIVEYIRSSPWSMSLCEDLERFGQEADDSWMLMRSLAVILVEKVTHLLHPPDTLLKLC